MIRLGIARKKPLENEPDIDRIIMEERLYHAPKILRSKRKKHSMSLYFLTPIEGREAAAF